MCYYFKHAFQHSTNMLFHIAETVTTWPAETNQKPKAVVTKTAVSASQTQMKTGIDKETFFFINKKLKIVVVNLLVNTLI